MKSSTVHVVQQHLNVTKVLLNNTHRTAFQLCQWNTEFVMFMIEVMLFISFSIIIIIKAFVLL